MRMKSWWAEEELAAVAKLFRKEAGQEVFYVLVSAKLAWGQP